MCVFSGAVTSASLPGTFGPVWTISSLLSAACSKWGDNQYVELNVNQPLMPVGFTAQVTYRVWGVGGSIISSTAPAWGLWLLKVLHKQQGTWGPVSGDGG